MQTSVYQLLMYSHPQALADLDSYQRRWYDCCISAHGEPVELLVTLKSQVEPSEEIGQLMKQAPSRSRGSCE